MRRAVLLLGPLLACSARPGDEPADGGAVLDGGAADGGVPNGGVADGGGSTDGGSTLAAPLLLAPTEPDRLFGGTRYDLLVRAVDPSTATLRLDGEALDCEPLQEDLWCPIVLEAGTHEVAYVDSTGAAARFRLTARDHDGVAPRGTAFPLGMYHVNRFSGFRELEENGYTLVQSYATGLYEPLEWQAEAGRAGLSTLL